MEDPRALADARADLLVLIGDLEKEARAIAESTSESPDDEHDAEGSTVGFERARVQSLLDQVRRRLADTDAALSRSRRGEYGRCKACGREIGQARLEALPTAELCVDCATSGVPGRAGGLSRTEFRGSR